MEHVKAVARHSQPDGFSFILRPRNGLLLRSSRAELTSRVIALLDGNESRFLALIAARGIAQLRWHREHNENDSIQRTGFIG